jgi:hypothetical protein
MSWILQASHKCVSLQFCLGMYGLHVKTVQELSLCNKRHTRRAQEITAGLHSMPKKEGTPCTCPLFTLTAGFGA